MQKSSLESPLMQYFALQVGKLEEGEYQNGPSKNPKTSVIHHFRDLSERVNQDFRDAGTTVISKKRCLI